MKAIALLFLFPICAHSEYKLNPYTNQRDYYEGTAALKVSTAALYELIINISTGAYTLGDLNVSGSVVAGGSVTASNFYGNGTTLTGVATSAQLTSTASALTSEIARATAREDAIGVSTGAIELSKVPYTGATTDVNLGAYQLTATSLSGTHYGSGLNLTSIPQLAAYNYWTNNNDFTDESYFHAKIHAHDIDMQYSSTPTITGVNVDDAAYKPILINPGIQVNTSYGYAYNWVKVDTSAVNAKYYTAGDDTGSWLNFNKYGLVISSGIRAGASRVDGSGGVGIINSDGKIPSLTSTYFADLDASALTGAPPDTTKLPLGGGTMTGSLILEPASISTGNIVFQGAYPHSIQFNNNSGATNQFLGEVQFLQNGTGQHRIITYGTTHATYPKEMQLGADSTGDGTNVRITGSAAMNPDLFVSSWTSVGVNTTSPNNAYKLDVNGDVNADYYYGDGSNLTGMPSGDVVLSATQTFTGANTFSLSATSSFTITCPSGFTSVQAQGNQLGCIQTAEQDIANQVGASTMCFALYGGRLPTMQETDIAFNAYTLTDETDDSEWLADVGWEVTENGFLRQTTGIPTVNVRTFMAAYRCWINR